MVDDSTRLAVRSSIARTALMITSIGVSFFMMPFMISKLGDMWYGILTLVQSLTGYYYWIDFGLASAVSRYVTLYITKKDEKNTNVIINTSLSIYIGMAFVICLMAVLFAYLSEYFVTDRTILQAVRIVIIIMGLTMALEFPFKAFAGLMGAFMRYDLLSASHFAILVLSTFLTVVLLAKGYGIISLAVIGLICSFFSNIIFFSIAKHLFPGMRIERQYIKKNRIGELFGYSIWAFVMQIGDQLRFRVDSFVIAWALTAVYVTHFSIGANIANYFLSFIFRATNFLTPLFTKYYAEGNDQRIRDGLLFATKINTIMAIFGGGLIIIVGKSFISKWVGDSYLDSYPVLIILTIAVVIEAIQTPSNNVLMAIAKHRFFAIVNLIEGLCNLIISLLLVKHYGLIGVALGTLIPLILSRLLVLPVYISKNIGLSLGKFYESIITVVGISMAYLTGFYFVTRDFLNLPEYWKSAMLFILSLPIYIVLVMFIFLDKSERAYVKNMFPQKLRDIL